MESEGDDDERMSGSMRSFQLPRDGTDWWWTMAACPCQQTVDRAGPFVTTRLLLLRRGPCLT